MPKYYDDHLAAAEKDTSSRNFCALVDAAASLYDRLRPDKGKSIRVDEEEERDNELVPTQTWTSMKNQQNLNGASTSSSPLNLNLIPEEEDPRTSLCLSSSSYSCLTDNTRNLKPQANVETPEWLIQLMRDMNGSDLTLIFKKKLFITDVNSKESRLSMPFNKLIRSDFLSPVEWRIIEDDIDKQDKIGVGAILVDQRTEKWGVILKRWELHKESGKGSWNYALTCGWNDVVKANHLKKNDEISIWCFRCRGILCFALHLVRPPPTTTTGQCSSSVAPLCL